jgi:hypothetical protein
MPHSGTGDGGRGPDTSSEKKNNAFQRLGKYFVLN